MSEPSTTERDRIEKLADSFMASYRAGQRPSIDAYVEQYPDLASELRGLIAALIVLERNAPRRIRSEPLPVERATVGPREIGEFSIVREIGRGGMGVVYEAVQQSLGRHVALKVLSSPGLLNPTHLERFRLEARSAGRLHHSHIVPVFGVGESDGLHYYAMQFIAGQSLDQVIEALRRMRPGRGSEKSASAVNEELTEPVAATGDASAVDDPSAPTKQSVTGQFSSGSSGQPFYECVARVGLQVAEALAYAHGEGILHRDIKPSNLLVDAKGDTWVTDFGLVKAEDTESLTETGDFVGTLRYMAPERLEGWSDRRSDIYSLGATLYELLTLRTFFAAANRGQLVDHIRHKQPEAPSKIDGAIPRDLETIVQKALAKEPASRYHTANEMAEDLRRFLEDKPILARRSTTREQFVRWCRRNRAVAVLTTAVGIALLAGMIASTWQAVRATQAEELAGKRLQKELAARQEADKARMAADEARTGETSQRKLAEERQAEAERQRAAADANYQRARIAVDKYFTLISENRLLDEPGLQPLRQELLEAADDFYEDAVNSRVGDLSVVADRAKAQLRLAILYVSMGQIDDGISAMQVAIKFVRQLQRDPDGAQYLPRVAGFWPGIRWWTEGFQPPKNTFTAAATVFLLESTWRELVEQFPDEPKFQRDLGAIQGIIASAQKNAGFARKSYEIATKLVKDHPQVMDYRADLVTAAILLARFEPGDLSERHRLVREAIEISEQMLVEDPTSPVGRTVLAFALHYFGMGARWHLPKEAEAAARRSIEISDALVSEFPDDAVLHRQFADAVAEWVSCPSADLNTQQARDWSDQAIAELEIRVRRRPNDRHGKQMLAILHYQVADRQAPLLGDADVTKGKHQRRALSLFTELADTFPDHALYSMNVEHMGWTNSRLAELAKHGNRPDEAAAHLAAAAAAFARLADNKQIPQRDGAYRGWEADARWELGQILVAQGKTSEAEAVARQYVDAAANLVEEYPTNSQYQQKLSSGLGFLAGILRNAGRGDEVVAVYRQATSRLIERADQSQIPLYCGTLLRDAGQFDQGIAVCDQLIARDPKMADAWSLRGSCHMWKRDYAVMAEDYSKAIELNPSDWWYWHERAFAYLRMGQHDKAIADHTKAIEISDQDAAQRLRRGHSYRALGELNKAEADYNKAIELDPAYWENWFARSRVNAARNRHDEADDDVAKAVELCPKDAQSLNHFAWELASPSSSTHSEATLAIKMAQDAVKLTSDNASLLNTLGTAQYRAGQWREAIDSLEKAENLAPGRSLGFNGLFLAMAHWQLGHEDESRTWYNRSVEWMERHEPENEELLRFRAEAEQLLDISNDNLPNQASVPTPLAPPNQRGGR